jgi:hypothetical protein
MGMISNCCWVSAIEETDLCSRCKEHAVFYDDQFLFIDDLVIGRIYRLKQKIIIFSKGYATITLPIGLHLIFMNKTKYKFFNNLYRLEFETEEGGIKINLWNKDIQIKELEERIKISR